jgi:hypothetical protein
MPEMLSPINKKKNADKDVIDDDQRQPVATSSKKF